MLIDCETCQVKGKGCPDCVISVLLDQPPLVELDTEEYDAVSVLAAGGLVPPLRMVPAIRAPVGERRSSSRRRARPA